MEEVKDYKQEIAATRKGCLGSSDGKLIAQVANLGVVPKSALKRLAVVKGLIEQTEIPKNAAIKAGDDIEMLIFEHLKQQDPRYESNPMLVSEKYSYNNVKLISHPDLLMKDEALKIVYLYEVKTTKYSVEETVTTYKPQLYIHYVMAKELAEKLGKEWSVRVFLVHYSTAGLNLEEGMEFDPTRITLKEIHFKVKLFDVSKGMSIINEFLHTFNTYYDGDEVNADLLPANVRSQFDEVAAALVEIKERENMVAQFKERLYKFMLDNDIKSIKNDVFSISRVDGSVSKSFDAKKYMEDMQKTHPRKAKKILEDYTRTSVNKGYCKIKVFENKDK